MAGAPCIMLFIPLHAVHPHAARASIKHDFQPGLGSCNANKEDSTTDYTDCADKEKSPKPHLLKIGINLCNQWLKRSK
jgi:hypothetical protein